MTEELKEHGIFQENSDIRAHVSDRVVYVCQTKEIITALKNNEFTKKFAYQQNYDKPTACGYLVTQSKIIDLRVLNFKSWNGWTFYKSEWNTSEKGKWAVKCITELIKIGRFPFWLNAEQNKDVELDIKGTDILIAMNQKIQVKCDYPALKTGNLYIQTHEINPYKMY
jgi:hypothetical protein